MNSRPPLHPCGIEVIGLHPRWARIVVARMHLSASPWPSWLDLFSRGEGMPPLDERMAVTFDGPSLVFHTTEASLEEDVAALEAHVNGTNAQFAASERARTRPASEPVRKFAATIDIHEAVSPEMQALLLATLRQARALSSVFQSAVWETEPQAAGGDTAGDETPVPVRPRQP